MMDIQLSLSSGQHMTGLGLAMLTGAFGLAGVFVGAFIQWGRDAWRDHKSRQQAAGYLAIRVVCLLDDLFERCAAIVGDDGEPDDAPDGFGEVFPKLKKPKDVEFPDDVDWKSIDMKLMYDILSINARLADANRALADAWENSSMPQHEEFFDERQERYAILAIDLLRITGELRSRYDIPDLDRGTWNPLEFLNARLTLSRVSQEGRAERVRNG